MKPKFGYIFTNLQVIAPAVTKCAMPTVDEDNRQFDLCDLHVKSRPNKNPGITSCILKRCTYVKNLEMIQPLLQE
jgi:hypothetical protein